VQTEAPVVGLQAEAAMVAEAATTAAPTAAAAMEAAEERLEATAGVICTSRLRR
jgi:hypothetical protein